MTGLIWQGKWAERGGLRPVEKTILPLEVVETINESNRTRRWRKSLTRDSGYRPPGARGWLKAASVCTLKEIRGCRGTLSADKMVPVLMAFS